MHQKVKVRSHATDIGGVGLSANSFADVYVEHMPEIVRYCRSILRDQADAEDAAQNAMERAMRALSDGPAPDRMRPWLFTIAQREALTVLRRRRRFSSAELDEAALGEQGSPEELAAVRERLAELLADVRELNPRQREGLVARELGGRSYRQIAASLGTTEAAAQQLVLEARQSLRQFEAGRSLECRDVQGWISAHDHARVGTRRVRSHLRACGGCRDFRRAIVGRRRDFGLLLPGLGAGSAWWSTLAGMLGHGGAKIVAAGAVVATGATVLVVSPLLERHPDLAPPMLREHLAVASVTTTQPLAATSVRLVGGLPPARGPRTASGTATRPAGGTPVRTPASRRLSTQHRTADTAQAPSPAAAPTAPERTTRAPAAPTPAPPAPAPASTPAALAPAQPVLDAAQPVTDVVREVAADVKDALPPPAVGLLP